MKMVEKIARDIYDKPTTFDGDTIATHLSQSMMIDGSATNADELYEIVRGVCRDAAIAALKAMEEPTIEMEVAGTEAWLCEAATEDRSRANWRAMIAAAIAEAQKEEER